MDNKNLEPKELLFKISTSAYMAAGLVSLDIASLYIHEYSHMAAMRVLFPNLNPYMICDDAACYANWGGTPRLRDGLSITYSTATGIVYAAGPIADMINVALSSIVAWKMRHSHRKISLLFATHAFMRAFLTSKYCLSTKGTGWGDFAYVEEKLGIPHDLQSAVTCSVVLGTIVSMAGLFFFEKNKDNQTETVTLKSERNKKWRQ